MAELLGSVGSSDPQRAATETAAEAAACDPARSMLSMGATSLSRVAMKLPLPSLLPLLSARLCSSRTTVAPAIENNSAIASHTVPSTPALCAAYSAAVLSKNPRSA